MNLPSGALVVGFGDDVVYLATADEFDLQWSESVESPQAKADKRV